LSTALANWQYFRPSTESTPAKITTSNQVGDPKNVPKFGARPPVHGEDSGKIVETTKDIIIRVFIYLFIYIVMGNSRTGQTARQIFA